MIWGGIDFLTSEGDQEKYKNAKNKMTHALMGMAILAASFVIVQFISTVFKIENEDDDPLIWVEWDNGERLALLQGIDKFKLVKK